jgi:hypothetical protein
VGFFVAVLGGGLAGAPVLRSTSTPIEASWRQQGVQQLAIKGAVSAYVYLVLDRNLSET